MNGPQIMPVLFVCHSGEDQLLLALRRYCKNFEVLVSQWNDRSGGEEPLAKIIKSDLRRSDLVVVVLSSQAAISPWVHQEIGLAVGLDKAIVPVCAQELKTLPGLLSGLPCITYPAGAIEETALRVATRVGDLLSKEMTRNFVTFRDYCEWWKGISEPRYTQERCLWAAPHDLWSWFSEARGQRTSIQYRTLIRGSSPFDHDTLKIHFGGDEIVVGVQELSAIQEIHVFGNLTVETFYSPEFMVELEKKLEQKQSEVELRTWFASMTAAETKIEVRLSMDATKAAGHRQRLDELFSMYRQKAQPIS